MQKRTKTGAVLSTIYLGVSLAQLALDIKDYKKTGNRLTALEDENRKLKARIGALEASQPSSAISGNLCVSIYAGDEHRNFILPTNDPKAALKRRGSIQDDIAGLFHDWGPNIPKEISVVCKTMNGNGSQWSRQIPLSSRDTYQTLTSAVMCTAGFRITRNGCEWNPENILSGGPKS